MIRTRYSNRCVRTRCLGGRGVRWMDGCLWVRVGGDDCRCGGVSYLPRVGADGFVVYSNSGEEAVVVAGCLVAKLGAVVS